MELRTDAEAQARLWLYVNSMPESCVGPTEAEQVWPCRVWVGRGVVGLGGVRTRRRKFTGLLFEQPRDTTAQQPRILTSIEQSAPYTPFLVFYHFLPYKM